MPSTMTPTQIREARKKLRLTQAQMGAMRDTDGTTIRRRGMGPDTRSHRDPAPRMVRLIQAYLGGWRDEDWPE